MDPSEKVPGAMTSAVLPPWDKENREEAGLLCMSVYNDLINENRVKLCEDLEPDGIWVRLRKHNILDKVTEERLKHNLPRPDVVLKLLDFVESGPCWRFHGFCRALALTDQSDLIPQGGLKPKVYEDGAPPKHLPRNLIKMIREHCKSNVKSLTKMSLFDFEGDPDDDNIDISQCFVPVDPILDGQQDSIVIPTNEILNQLSDEDPPQVVRMYGDPGDGKTSLMRHIAHGMSAEFLKLTDEEVSAKCPRWTTVIYLSAPKIKGTIEEAIWDELGCKESDAKTLMAHVATGDGTAVFMDSLDEVRDKEVLKNIKHYVHQRKKKGGPTVLIAARTDLCPIDASDIDRTITLQGFTDAQGLDYVKRYTEMCAVLQKPEQPPLVEYVNQHREELKSVLSNPLCLYIFCLLAVRGELDLINERVFNIPKLFGLLERYLLRREGSEVTDKQRKEFYRLCMHGQLNDLWEFPESLLAKFNISKAHYIFLKRSSKRGPDGASVTYYSFSHEQFYEYFASRYLHSLTSEQKKSLLLSICVNEQLRNVQYIIFQLLLQEWEAQKDLIVSMIRCMLILQFTSPDNKVEGKFIDLMSLRYIVMNISSDLRNSGKIWKDVNDVFEKYSHRLQDSGWFGYLCANRAISHVRKCLQACRLQQQEAIFKSTISRMMPCTWEGFYTTDFFQVDSTRWGKMQFHSDGKHSIFVQCPREACKMLMQYQKRYRWERLSINFYSGDTPKTAWSKDEWYGLLQELTSVDTLEIWATKKTPLTGIFRALVENMTHRIMQIQVNSGQVSLVDLLGSLVLCKQVPNLCLDLFGTYVVVPSGQDEVMLQAQRDRVCRITRKERLDDSVCIDVPILSKTKWVTESWEKYVWSDRR